MEVPPPPDCSPIPPSEYPQIPIRTSPATVESLQASYTSGNIQMFREILESHISSSEDFEIRDFASIMNDAIELGNLDFVEELLHHGLPLHLTYALDAIQVKNKSILDVFLENGLDLTEPMGAFRPSIPGYANTDHEMVTWLLDHGADPNRQCVVDLTPLSFAVEDAPLAVIELMLSRGGDTRRGQLLHHAVERETDNIAVLKLLLATGAAINATMYEDHYPSLALYCFMALGTPLHRAAELGKVEVIQYLLSQGADVSIKNAKGNTAVECERQFNQSEVIQLLEEAP